MSRPKLDRLPEYDERSRQYPIATLLAATQAPRSYTWSCDIYNDQGQEGACVGFAWSHELSARPKVVPTYEAGAQEIYHRAQQLDQWAGEDYEGTSVLAGAKAVMERVNSAGVPLIREYRWAFTVNDIIMTLGYKGPVVFGVNWYEGMWDVDANGFLSVDGDLAGGHAILANGVKIVRKDALQPYSLSNIDTHKSFVKLHNSWGTNWGVGGNAKLRLDGLNKLMPNGDFCVPVVRSYA